MRSTTLLAGLTLWLTVLGLACGSSGGGGSGDDDDDGPCLSECAAPFATLVAEQVERDDDGIERPFLMKFTTETSVPSEIEWRFDARVGGTTYQPGESIELHPYEKAGSYDVFLRVTNERSRKSREIHRQVHVADDLATVGADIDEVTSAGEPDSTIVNFFIESLNLTVFTWDFNGDGEFDEDDGPNRSGPSASFDFEDEGLYEIRVKGERFDGDDDPIIKRYEVEVGDTPEGLEAMFSTEITNADVLPVPDPLPGSNVIMGSPGMEVQFTDTSTGDIVEWYWDFGNGQDSTVEAPAAVVYDAPGYYTVTLYVKDSADKESKHERLVAATFPESGVRFELIWSNTTGTGNGVGTNALIADAGDHVAVDIYVQVAADTEVDRVVNQLQFAGGGAAAFTDFRDYEEFEVVKPDPCGLDCQRDFGVELKDADTVVGETSRGYGVWDLQEPELAPGAGTPAGGRPGPEVIRMGRFYLEVQDPTLNPRLFFQTVFGGGERFASLDGVLQPLVIAEACLSDEALGGTTSDPGCPVAY